MVYIKRLINVSMQNEIILFSFFFFKLNYFLGAVIGHLMSKKRTTKQGLYALQLLAEKLFHTVCVPLEDA